MQVGKYNGQHKHALEIWFIRHAESESNAGLPTSYTHQIRLTEHGKRQAQEISTIFKYAPDLIITSPYQRARETAKPTRVRFSNARYQIWSVEEFTFLGSMRGKLTTREDRWEKVRAFWDLCDPDYTDEGGESYKQFIARVRLSMEYLKHQGANFIVVFSHEQFIHAVRFIQHWKQTELLETPEAMNEFRRMLADSPILNGDVYKILLPRIEENGHQNYVIPDKKLPRDLLVSMIKR